MISAVLTMAALSACVPARWGSARVESLELLRASPVNCLLVEEKHWQPAFVAAAHERGLTLLALVGSSSIERAEGLAFDGYVVEGVASERLLKSGRPVVELRPRTRIDPAQAGGLIATAQGLLAGRARGARGRGARAAFRRAVD